MLILPILIHLRNILKVSSDENLTSKLYILRSTYLEVVFAVRIAGKAR